MSLTDSYEFARASIPHHELEAQGIARAIRADTRDWQRHTAATDSETWEAISPVEPDPRIEDRSQTADGITAALPIHPQTSAPSSPEKAVAAAIPQRQSSRSVAADADEGLTVGEHLDHQSVPSSSQQEQQSARYAPHQSFGSPTSSPSRRQREVDTLSSDLSLHSGDSAGSGSPSRQLRRQQIQEQPSVMAPPSAWSQPGSRLRGAGATRNGGEGSTRTRSSSLSLNASQGPQSSPIFDFVVTTSGQILNADFAGAETLQRVKSATWRGYSSRAFDKHWEPSGSRMPASLIFQKTQPVDDCPSSSASDLASSSKMQDGPSSANGSSSGPSFSSMNTEQKGPGGVRRRLFSRASKPGSKGAELGASSNTSYQRPGGGFVRRVSSKSFFRKDIGSAKDTDKHAQIENTAMQSTDTLSGSSIMSDAQQERSESRASNASSKSTNNPFSAWAHRRRTKSSSPALSLSPYGDAESIHDADASLSPSSAFTELPRQSIDSQASSRASVSIFGRKRGQSFVSVSSSGVAEASARNGEALPKRLSGWIMNVMNREEAMPRDRSTSASPTGDQPETEVEPFAGLSATLSNTIPSAALRASSNSIFNPPDFATKHNTGLLSSLASPAARPFRFFMESTSDLLGRADNTGGCWLLGVWHGKGSSLEVEDDSAEQDATTPSITLSSATPKGNKTSRLHRGTRNDRTPSPDLTGPTRDGFDSPSLPKSPPLVSVSALSARNSDSLWQQDFQSDFQSRIWCTYRSHFVAITRDGAISDEAAAAAAEQTAALEAEQLSLHGSVPEMVVSTCSGNGSRQASSPFSNGLSQSIPSTSLPLGAAAGIGERMGIPGLWHRATAVAQAAGLAGRSGLTTDAGWGCMLRTGQSLLANALVHVTFGRNWRRPQSAADLDEDAERRREYARYIRILTWFMDDPSPACPFSVHRMAREGKSLGKEVGEWFGPSTAAGAIKRLVDECAEAKLGVVVATDGEIYLSHIKAASRIRGKKNTWERPVLILIGVRLGLSGVNPTYYESIKTTFAFPHTAGIAGGRPSSSYYFVGVQDSSLLYLDPHHVRPSVPFRFPPPSLSGAELDKWLCRAYSEAQIGTFHCDRVRRMPLRSLDPSMLLGFICTDEQSLEDFCSRVKALPKTLFSIAENPPKWAQQVDDLELAMESFSDDSFDADVEEEHGQDSLLLEKDDQNQEARVVIGQNGKGEEQKERAGTAAHERISSWTHEAATRQPFPQALKKDISSEGNSNSDSSLGLGVRFPTMSERERGSDEDRGEELDGVESRSTRLRPTTDRITSSASGTSDLTERERSDSAAQRIPLKYLVHAQSHSPSFRRSRVQSRPSAFTSTSVSVSVPAAEAGAEGAAKVDESGIDESFSTLDFSDADDSSGSTTGVDRWEQIPRTSHRRAPEPRPDDCQTESEVLGRTPSLYSHTLYPQQQRQQQRDAAPLPPSTPEGNDEEHHEVEKNDTQFVHRTAHAL